MIATSISKSMEGMMAKTVSCFPAASKLLAKRKWVTEKEFYLGDVSGATRVLTPVYFDTDFNKKIYLMDCVTGTLFKPKDGKCLTSDTLHLKKFTKKDGLDQLLIKVKSQQYMGGGESV